MVFFSGEQKKAHFGSSATHDGGTQDAARFGRRASPCDGLWRED